MKNERTWVKENSFYLEDDNILYVIAVGEVDDETASACKEAILKLASTKEEKVNLLVDLNKAGKSSPEARSVWTSIGNNEKIGKVALFGLHPVARVLASFFMKMIAQNNLRFFNEKEKALEWFKE